MNEQALFCDGTASYVIPQEPQENETVRLRFRTAKNDARRVRLMTAVGGYDMRKEGGRDDGKDGGNDSEFDYYTINYEIE